MNNQAVQESQQSYMERMRHDLFTALTSRVLTEEEMARAVAFGSSLNIGFGEKHDPAQKERELSDALETQARLRRAATAGTP
jgi:hypothetical protein